VPDDVCVATRARVGAGHSQVFHRSNEGVDVDWIDRPVARPGVARVVVDAQVGVGDFEVHHTNVSGNPDEPGNTGCA
jgi:hypothetical protein